MSSKLLPLALVCLASVAMVVAFQGQKPQPQGADQKISSLKSDLNRVRQERSAVSKKLSQTRRQVRRVRGDIVAIDGRLGSLEQSLEVTTSRLERGISDQVRLADELKVATHELQQKREQVRARLRWMYVHEGQSVVSALITARDVSELASRSTMLRRIASADRELFDAYKELQERVADQKRRQDELVMRVAGLKRSQESQRAELKVARQDKADALGDLRAQQRELERLIAQLDAEEEAITARIALYNAGAGKTSGLKPFTGRFSRPVNGSITSGFGMRLHPILRRNRMHNGIDFGAGHGSPIRAAAEGIVIVATYTKGYGNMVILDHGGGVSTLYGHCSRFMVREGQRVDRGQTIAAVGSTGLATGPHLHFEVRIGGKPVNPLGRL